MRRLRIENVQIGAVMQIYLETMQHGACWCCCCWTTRRGDWEWNSRFSWPFICFHVGRNRLCNRWTLHDAGGAGGGHHRCRNNKETKAVASRAGESGARGGRGGGGRKAVGSHGKRCNKLFDGLLQSKFLSSLFSLVASIAVPTSPLPPSLVALLGST